MHGVSHTTLHAPCKAHSLHYTHRRARCTTRHELCRLHHAKSHYATRTVQATLRSTPHYPMHTVQATLPYNALCYTTLHALRYTTLHVLHGAPLHWTWWPAPLPKYYTTLHGTALHYTTHDTALHFRPRTTLHYTIDYPLQSWNPLGYTCLVYDYTRLVHDCIWPCAHLV